MKTPEKNSLRAKIKYMNDKVAWMQLRNVLDEACQNKQIAISEEVVDFVQKMLIAATKGYKEASADEAFSAISYLFKSHNARDSVLKRHEDKIKIREIVKQEWIKDKASYESKADFCRIYTSRIYQRFNYHISEKTIHGRWLKGL